MAQSADCQNLLIVGGAVERPPLLILPLLDPSRRERQSQRLFWGETVNDSTLGSSHLARNRMNDEQPIERTIEQ